MMRLLDGTILRSNNQRDAYSQAECYREGRFVKRSERRSLALYRQAAEEGDARAYFRLGQHEQTNSRWSVAFELFLQAGLRNSNEVIPWLDTLVSQNNAEAALVLGKIAQYRKQFDKAIQSYTKAHELNHPDGMFYFGKMYSNLMSTQTRGIDITNRYRDSARLGSKHGLNELLLLSASNGKASLHLAQMYELGEVVIHKNLLKAIEFYEKSSEQRCYEATYYLAELYAKGKPEVAIDISKACRYYLLASQQGHASAISSWQAWAQRGPAEAQYRLGYDYYRTRSLGYSSYSTQYDISNAVTWCVKAEIQGHSSAAAYLSGTFTAEIFWKIACEYDASALNLEKSKKKAIEYAVKASGLGLKEASAYVARMYQQGKQSVRANHQKSLEYYALAAKQGQDSARQTLEQIAESGDKDAQYHLGYGYYHEKNEIERAIYWCVKAEAQGHIQAKKYLENTFPKEICWKISSCYTSEKSNLARNQQKALEYALEASQLGVKDASEYVAYVYQEGREGIAIDRKKSYHYFAVAAIQGSSLSLSILEKYAEEGFAEAQYCLGYEYYYAMRNVEKSVIWCVKAEIHGHKKAAEYLKTNFGADIYRIIACQYETDITSAETSMPKAIEFFKKAAQLHHVQASIWLAHYYQSLPEKSVENETLAFNYFSQAANNGHEEAFSALERLGKNLNIQQRTALSQVNSGFFYNASNSMYWNTQNQAIKLKKNQLRK